MHGAAEGPKGSNIFPSPRRRDRLTRPAHSNPSSMYSASINDTEIPDDRNRTCVDPETQTASKIVLVPQVDLPGQFLRE